MKKTKRYLKRLVIPLSLLITIIFVYFFAVVTLPYILPAINSITIISAKLNFNPISKDIINVRKNIEDIESLNNINNTIISQDPHYNLEIPYVGEDKIPTSNTPSQVESPAVTKPENAGTVIKEKYTNGTSSVYINLNNGYIKNYTSISADKILETVKNQPSIKIKADLKPEVLIMHTHATESYKLDNNLWFDKNHSFRTTDNQNNVTRVGDEIEKQLISAGIGVIHDKTLHDYPSYNGSYERSAETVKRILKENPTIKIVLDVHRDAIQPSADTIIGPATVINGKSAAQIMIISGCDDGTMNMPKYMENLKFSSAFQRQMEKDYPSLTRPILFDYRKYNQDLTTGSILLEMGGHGNTLEEAIYAGELAGKSLAKILLTLK